MTDEEVFKSLLAEGAFTKEMLASGITNIRKANYAKKGAYFYAFTGLSTGLERIGKLCLIINYIIENNGNLPDKKYANYLKHDIQHDITKIVHHCKEIKTNKKYEFTFLNEIDDEIHNRLINILSRFSKGDRYSNIDFVTNTRNYDDPISVWYTQIDMYILENKVPQNKKIKFQYNADLIHKMISEHATMYHVSESGKDIRSVFDASLQTGINEAVAPFRQFYLLQIARYFSELISALEYESKMKGQKLIPFFGEQFGFFYNDDAFLKSQKNWEKFT